MRCSGLSSCVMVRYANRFSSRLLSSRASSSPDCDRYLWRLQCSSKLHIQTNFNHRLLFSCKVYQFAKVRPLKSVFEIVWDGLFLLRGVSIDYRLLKILTDFHVLLAPRGLLQKHNLKDLCCILEAVLCEFPITQSRWIFHRRAVIL